MSVLNMGLTDCIVRRTGRNACLVIDMTFAPYTEDMTFALYTEDTP